MELVVVLRSVDVVEVVTALALRETLMLAGLVGTAVLVGARVDSEVRAPVREYKAAQSLRLVPCLKISSALTHRMGLGVYIWTTPRPVRVIGAVIALITSIA